MDFPMCPYFSLYFPRIFLRFSGHHPRPSPRPWPLPRSLGFASSEWFRVKASSSDAWEIRLEMSTRGNWYMISMIYNVSEYWGNIFFLILNTWKLYSIVNKLILIGIMMVGHKLVKMTKQIHIRLSETVWTLKISTALDAVPWDAPASHPGKGSSWAQRAFLGKWKVCVWGRRCSLSLLHFHFLDSQPINQHTWIIYHTHTYMEREREGINLTRTHTQTVPYSHCAGWSTKCGPVVKSKLISPWTAQGQPLDSQKKHLSRLTGW